MITEEVARFDAKMSVSHKKMLEEAASLKGFKNLSEYVITTMVENAKKVIDEYSKVVYTVQDKEKIMHVLNEPTEVTDSFKRAAQKRSELLDEKVFNA